MPQRDNFDVARVLLAKAIEDEVLVQTVVENPDIGDAIVGFHGQQAVEKLAKAVLTLPMGSRLSRRTISIT